MHLITSRVSSYQFCIIFCYPPSSCIVLSISMLDCSILLVIISLVRAFVDVFLTYGLVTCIGMIVEVCQWLNGGLKRHAEIDHLCLQLLQQDCLSSFDDTQDDSYARRSVMDILANWLKSNRQSLQECNTARVLMDADIRILAHQLMIWTHIWQFGLKIEWLTQWGRCAKIIFCRNLRCAHFFWKCI